MAAVNKVGTSEADTFPGSVLLDRYQIGQRLGEGASSQVFLATDGAEKTPCAVKLFRADLDGPAVARLLDEFNHMSALEHRGIVRVKDAGRVSGGPWAGRLFLVTDYVAGPDLGTFLAGCPEEKRFRRFAGLCEDAADALAYLHGRGLIHGDLCPANVRCDHEGHPVLIDLGLSRVIGQGQPAAGGAFGTLGFVAPEALVGERGPAADLFGLGATLYAAWTGVPPFGQGLESVRRLMEGPAVAASSLCPGLPSEWDGLLEHLLAISPDGRPASAAHLLREIRRLRPGASVELELSIPQPAGDPLAGLLVGRESELRTIATLIEQLAEGGASASVLTISGPPGSGRQSLMRRAARDARLALLAETLPTFVIDDRGFAALGAELPREIKESSGPWEDPARALQIRILAMADALEARSKQSPLCVLLGPGREEELLAQAIAGSPGNGRLLLLVASERSMRGATDVALRPLDSTDIHALGSRAAGIEPSASVVAQIARASGGLAAVVALLVRRWVQDAREGGAESFRLDSDDTDWAHLLDGTFAGLDGKTRLWLAHMVFLGSPLTSQVNLGNELEAAREAEAAGWWDGARLAVPTEAHGSAVFRAAQHDGLLHPAARLATTALEESDPRRAEAHFVLGDLKAAARCFQAAAAKAAQTGRFSEVAEFALRVLSLDPTLGVSHEHAIWATALGLVGQYDAALQLLSSAQPQDPQAASELAERHAWLLGRRGDPMAARQVLEVALQESERSGPSTAQALLRARLARLLVSCGLHGEALQVARPVLHESSAAGHFAQEAAALALSYNGRLAEALELILALERTVESEQDKPLAARVAALRGLHAQLAGLPESAAEAYREAARRCEVLHDPHGLAAATFNLGCVLADLGQFGEALTALQRALRELGRLGIATDLSLALYNTGVLLLQLGDLDAAARVARRLRDEATATRAQAFMAYAHSLEADLARRQGALAAALSMYQAAEQAFVRAGNQPLADASALARAETLAEAGQGQEAMALWKQAHERPSEAGSGDSESSTLSRAHILLSGASEPDTELGSRLASMADKALTRGQKPLAWRAAQRSARVFEKNGDVRATEQHQRAASIFEEITMNTPLQYQAGLHRDPDAPSSSLSPQERTSAVQLAERAARAEGRLRRLQRINKRLNSDLRLSRVLEAVIDTAIEMTDAERGFLLLKDSSGELVVKVARNIDQTTLDAPDFVLSRSIAKQAAEKGEPVVTVDAAGDKRFREAVSVSDLHLRSVLAVPLSVKGTVVGTIYVDHRLRKGVFDDDALGMVMDFAEQAAIAIENARLLAELRRRENQVQSLNRRLEHELKVQTQTLQGVREELKESRQVAALRYDYRQIVGRTPRMQELFRLLDRVTDTALPVVIEGESGTGKELVARAIHYNGPRRERPFVSENCAAIPETLLESTLFGHVKGAFTGAERDSRGLFAVADGGTLFLDEVAEMSPGMQGKLLRVLQDGEFHRVGGERPQKVDVRVLVATNKNLERMVAQGKFRQDLFFRISVVRLLLPPLRERSEDIPLLAQHFLKKAATAAGGTAKSIEPAAVAKLCSYRWPGNVRELENEMTRAHAFSGASVTVADLAPAIRAGSDAVALDERDGFRLKPRVERLERMLIREAMSSHDGNQTKAAKALGLSRFGLQKKLLRYRIAT